MFCEQILSRLDPDAPSPQQAIDWLDLTWFDCTQRALRKRTRGDLEVRILLPVGQTPGHGDVLYHDANLTIAVDLVPTQVLVARPNTLAEMGRLAIELGNLHVPAEVCGNELIVIPDGPTRALLDRSGVPYEYDLRRFVPERSSVSAIPTRAGDFKISRAAPVSRASRPC